MSFVWGAGELCSDHRPACGASSELSFLPLQTGGTRRSRPPPRAERQNVGWHTARRAGLVRKVRTEDPVDPTLGSNGGKENKERVGGGRDISQGEWEDTRFELDQNRAVRHGTRLLLGKVRPCGPSQASRHSRLRGDQETGRELGSHLLLELGAPGLQFVLGEFPS